MNSETNNRLNNTSNGNNNGRSSRNLKKDKHRKRNVIWFNPPFCKLSTIDIGKYFYFIIIIMS